MLDCGTSTVRAGYAGEDTPEAIFPSVRHPRRWQEGPGYLPDVSERSASQIVGFAAGDQRQESGTKRQKTNASVQPTRKLRAGSAALDYRHEDFEVEWIAFDCHKRHVNTLMSSCPLTAATCIWERSSYEH